MDGRLGAAADTTWGLSGPDFLALYLAALVAALAAGWWHLKRPRSPGQDPLGLNDYEVALLGFGGGEDRAVAVAMLRLRAAGLIDPGEGALQERADAEGLDHLRLSWRIQERWNPLDFTPPIGRIRPLPADAHPLERVVYEAAAGLPDAAAVRARARRSPVLAVMRQRLFDMGLLVHKTPRAQRRWRWLVWATYWAVWFIVSVRFFSVRDLDLWVNVVWVLHAVALFPVAHLSVNLELEPATPRGRRVRHELWRPFENAEADIEEVNLGPGETGERFSLRRLALSGCGELWEKKPILALALRLPDQPIRVDDGG